LLSLGLLAAGLVTQAWAQGTINLFRSVAPPSGLVSNPAEALGMRSETVGAVSYVALTVEAANYFRTRSLAPETMQIALPGGGDSVVCAFSSEVTTDGLIVMRGTPTGGGIGDRCQLVVEDGRVTGIIDVPRGRYAIRPLEAADMHAVVQVRTEAFPDELEARAIAAQDPGTGRRNVPMCDVPIRQGQQPKTFGPIRVMIAYTPAAKRESRSITADIQIMIQQLRDVFSPRLTGGNFSVSAELAHSVEVNYREETDSPNMSKDLDRLSNRQDPIFGAIHRLRDTHKADLVHLVIKGRRNDDCGVGWMSRDITRIGDDLGFSLSDRSCAVDNYSFAHELGHNLGMNHDRYVVEKMPRPEDKPQPGEFNFGYVLLQHGVRDTMAYNDVCKAAGKNCRRLLVYSNPNMQWTNPATGAQNVPLGRPLNARDAAYNAEVLCRTAGVIARFR